jgi:hypothetical protein
MGVLMFAMVARVVWLVDLTARFLKRN